MMDVENVDASDVAPSVSVSASPTLSTSAAADGVIEAQRNVDGKPDEYVADETVLAYHGPQLYPAKVMKAEHRDNGMQYFVHYNGWNKKWDEWVDTTRLLKYNDHNVAYQHSLLQQKEAASRAGKQSSNRQSKPGGRSDKSGGAGSKRKSTAIAVDDDTVHDDSGAVVQNEVKIKIPANLKKQLIVDWENVTRKQCIVPLPHPIKTVSQILDEFAASKVGKGDGNESISREVSIGLRNYFDRALGTILLYRYERVQYEEYVEQHPDVQMSNVYGVEHLLRLFVKLPALLQATKLDGKELKILCDKVQDILKYLDARIAGQHHLFVKQYQPTDKIYQDKYAQI